MARLALFLQDGSIDGSKVLDTRLLNEAMQRVPGMHGLPVATLSDYRYQHGFWARNLQQAFGTAAPAWVPFMSGFGGITVAMLPNGVIWYSIADDGELASIDFAGPAREAIKDRKSVVSGKSVSVRVDFGGGRTIKKKKK